MKTVVLIAAVAAFGGGCGVTRVFWLKRNADSLERHREEDRDLDARKHQDQ